MWNAVYFRDGGLVRVQFETSEEAQRLLDYIEGRMERDGTAYEIVGVEEAVRVAG